MPESFTSSQPEQRFKPAFENAETGEHEPTAPGLRVEWHTPEGVKPEQPRFDCDPQKVREIALKMDIPAAEIESTYINILDRPSLDEFGLASYDSRGATVEDGYDTLEYKHAITLAGGFNPEGHPDEIEATFGNALVHELEHLKQRTEGRLEQGSSSERRATRMGRLAALGTKLAPAAVALLSPKLLTENFAFKMLDRFSELPPEKVATWVAVGATGVVAALGHRRIGQETYQAARGFFHKFDALENGARAAEKVFGPQCDAIKVPRNLKSRKFVGVG